ncbi:TRC40/GET3/ArsA family transport-energizing ATPase [Rhodococcus hoagii]|uniref:ArsA family ATPase n=1 Tax=Rhodococcus hoagii TaxID=43767 RepID=UPI0011A19CDE|nr:ArsA family ATPase [Prescottella equi]NKS34311.1 TRC40/GET3/ArsA family transport-energizing ATPase [Prescottella equi]
MSAAASGSAAAVRFFVGKGGAGKTTTAAATAVGAALSGERVLLVSLDRAHGLADVLDHPIAPGEPTRVAPALDVLEIDTLALLEERYRGLVALLALGGAHDHGADLTDLAPEELTGLPGVEDVLGLGEVVRSADESRWDTIVVDCPATSDVQRLLSLPESVAGYIERVWPQHRRMAALTSGDTGIAVVVAMVDRVLETASAITALLSDRERTTIRVVTTAERMAAAETRRLLSALALGALRVDAVIVNGLLPDIEADESNAGGWYRARRGAQDAVLADLRVAAGDVVVLPVDQLATEPIGLKALDGVARILYPGVSRPSAALTADTEPIRVALESGSGGLESVYAMRMHLPLADPRALTLGRVEDDLVVGADGKRRRVRLASVLRRCTVRDADFDGTDLVVRFVPDPAVWPQ